MDFPRGVGRAAIAVLAVGISLILTASAFAASSPTTNGSGGTAADGGVSATAYSRGHHYPGDSRHMGDRILRLGMRGHDVRVLQDYLSQSGFQTPITGYFGRLTKHNVVAFQRWRGMRANGVVTWSVSQTLRSVVAEVAASQPPVTKAKIENGLAVAPSNAPTVIKEVIAAANKIAFKPYVYGGGHGSWNSSGYDCSGSVSYALHGGGLLDSPEDSSQLESYGSSGKGRWITIWANAGHVYMYVAGLRFDTAAQGSGGGSRWTYSRTSSAGFVERHPTGY